MSWRGWWLRGSRRWRSRAGERGRNAWATRTAAEIEAELEDHVERRTAALVRRGVPPAQARAEALRRFGDAQRIEEELMQMAERRRRRSRIRRVLEDARRDGMVALRGIVRQPLFAFIVVFTVALGVGAATAVFGLVNAVLIRPLPYDSPDRLVRVHNRWEGTPEGNLSPAEYFDYVDGTGGAFASFGAWTSGALNVTGDSDPERVSAAFVSAGGLAAFGVEPVLGRVFTAEEEATPIVLLSHGFWQRRFAGTRDVVGRTIVLNGSTVTIIGVMPAGFALPDAFLPDAAHELYLPLGLSRANVTARGSHYLDGIGRLAVDVSRAQGEAVLEAIANRFVAEFPDDYPRDMRFGVYVEPVSEGVVGDVRGLLLILMGAVGFVLLIAASNVSALMLTRAEARRRELAVRSALGAGRTRLARMQLVESGVLALGGGALGLALAVLCTRAMVALRPPGVPRLDAIPLDARVVGFALVVAVLSGIAFGVVPVLAGRVPFAALREGGRGGAQGRRGHAFRRTLIVVELALALVLLAGAGLLVRTMQSLLGTDPGFEPTGVLTTRVSLPSQSYGTDEARRLFWSELERRIAELPGVNAAGAVTNLPLATSLGDLNFMIEGREIGEGEVSPRFDWQVVTPGYFEAVGMRVIRGRGIEAQDRTDAPGVVVLNESAAALYFPDGAIGQRFVLGGNAGPGLVTVVGIVNDVRHSGLGAPARGEMYLAHTQFRFWNGGNAVSAMNLVVRTAGDPATFASPVREAMKALDPALPPAHSGRSRRSSPTLSPVRASRSCCSALSPYSLCCSPPSARTA